MVIKHITVEAFGAAAFYEAAPDPAFCILDTLFAPELSAALGILFCRDAAGSLPGGWVRRDTRIRAEVELAGSLYLARAAPDLPGHLLLKVTDPRGNDVTDRYRRALSHTPEQDDMESFDGGDAALSRRLARYRSWGDHEGDRLPEKTGGFARSKTFRAFLLRYIKNFSPQKINGQKPFCIALDRQGVFRPALPGTAGDVSLSETEKRLFLYLCFLAIAEFWTGIEELRDLHHEKKPLLVRNFLEFLDEETDIGSLIRRTLSLGRQVILLTEPLPPRVKEKWESSA